MRFPTRALSILALAVLTLAGGCDIQQTVDPSGDDSGGALFSVISISVQPSSHTLKVGETVELSAMQVTSNKKDRQVNWSTSASDVASVSSTGIVTARAPGMASIVAQAGGKRDAAEITVQAEGPTPSRMRISPSADTINAIGFFTTLAASVRSDDGESVVGGPVTWTSLDPARASVSEDGNVIGKSVGTVLIVAAAAGFADTAVISVRQVPFQLRVAPANMALTAGATGQLVATLTDSAGTAIPGRNTMWSSSTAGVATVSGSGLVTGVAAGSATITATSEGKSGTASVVVSAPVPPPAGQFVSYPNAQIAFIAGPQVVAGTSPWSFFDANASTTGRRHGSAFVWTIESTNYYDQGLVQYINYYRTGDATFRTYARNIADTWYAGEYIREGTAPTDERGFSPRRVSLGGLMLRALDGRPEMWDWMYRYVNYMYWLWVERFNGNTHEIINSYREPGYITLYAAQLAKVLPDSYPRVGGGMVTDGAAKRADLLQRLERDAVGYFTVTQRAEGSWRWTSSEENVYETMPMVFMGVWLEGLVAIDQVSSNAAVHTALRSAIVRYATHLGTSGVYRLSDGVIGTDGKPMGVNFRSSWYFYHGGTTSNRTAYATGGGAHPTNQPIPYLDMIREQRQLNPTHLHVFGYAYRLTGDPKFLAWGDEWFASTFGKGQGPLADAWYALCDWNEKSYNQCYRSSGRYLAWRAGHP